MGRLKSTVFGCILICVAVPALGLGVPQKKFIARMVEPLPLWGSTSHTGAAWLSPFGAKHPANRPWRVPMLRPLQQFGLPGFGAYGPAKAHYYFDQIPNFDSAAHSTGHRCSMGGQAPGDVAATTSTDRWTILSCESGPSF